eukprot:755482-Hanusia_phi.AAC.4
MREGEEKRGKDHRKWFDSGPEGCLPINCCPVRASDSGRVGGLKRPGGRRGGRKDPQGKDPRRPTPVRGRRGGRWKAGVMGRREGRGGTGFRNRQQSKHGRA